MFSSFASVYWLRMCLCISSTQLYPLSLETHYDPITMHTFLCNCGPSRVYGLTSKSPRQFCSVELKLQHLVGPSLQDKPSNVVASLHCAHVLRVWSECVSIHQPCIDYTCTFQLCSVRLYYDCSLPS